MKKQAINTRTQEEYDALMEWRRSKGKSDIAPFTWEVYKAETVIITGGLYLYYGEKSKCINDGYVIIPFTEFAKANIVEEKMHKGSLRMFISELKKEFPEMDLDYLDLAADRFIENNPDAFFNREDTLQEAILLLEEADNRIYNAPILCAKIKQFLTNHKDGE